MTLVKDGNMPDITEFIAISEGVELTGFTSAWIRKLIKDESSRVRGYQFGKHKKSEWVVHRQDLLDYLERRKQEEIERYSIKK